MKPLNLYFDHTILKADATKEQVEKLCKEAVEHNFFSVCVNSCYVPLAAKLLRDSNVKIAAVVGFPLGACTTETKAFETEQACAMGAAEVDMVLNVGMFKSGEKEFCQNDIKAVVDAAKKHNAIVKVILETCLLTDEEIVEACKLSERAGAQFVKTSTGFGSAGATSKHVRIMKETVGDRLEVKASGGIRDYKTTMEMIQAGADRIGASAGVDIMKEFNENNQ